VLGRSLALPYILPASPIWMQRPSPGALGKTAAKNTQKLMDAGTSGNLRRTGTRGTPDATAHAHVGKTKAELLKTGGYDWKAGGVGGARAYLIQKAYVSEDCEDELTLESLSLVLLRAVASKDVSAMAADAIRAVAFLLEERNPEFMADMASAMNALTTDVQKILAYAEERVGGREPRDESGENETSAEELRRAAEMLTRTVEEQREELSTLTERLETGLASVLERAETGAVQPPATAAAVDGARSYASATAAAMQKGGGGGGGTAPMRHAAAVANAQMRERQVMVDRSPLSSRHTA
jgi:hypothetical protein